ncbi:hypothetical protein [Actinomadura meridiana]
MTQEELVQWAKNEQDRLAQLVRDRQEDLGGTLASIAYAPVSAAIEFLRIQAPGSTFLSVAEGAVRATKFDALTAIDQVRGSLDRWVAFVEDGLAQVRPFPVEARIAAATDLMEQVQQLLDDDPRHIAAPVVLAGAALEEFLRSRIEARGLTVTMKPGINTYAGMLRADGDLTAQEAMPFS